MAFNSVKQDFSRCESLTLVSSESCNLHCKYCALACSINDEKHKQDAEAVKQSFIDGSYLQNIKIVGEKYGMIPEKIKTLSLWGQEPTLTLNEFGMMFIDLYKYCPNLETLFFSTNGVAHSDRIVKLAKTIDSVINKQFFLSFQFSYDGKESTTNLRGIHYQIVLDNIQKTIKSLSETTFKNLRVNILFHNVVSDVLINKYAKETDENFYQYLKEFDDLSILFQSLNNNPRVRVEPRFSPGLINPYNGSKEEGQNLALFINRAIKLGKDLKSQWWRGLLWQQLEYLRYSPNREHPSKKVLEMIQSNYDKRIIESLSSACGCGFGDYDIKIRYNGEILYCQNAIVVAKTEEYEDRQGLRFDVSREMVKHNYFPNGLDDTQKKDVEKFFLKAYTIKHSSYPFFLSEVLNLMFLLLDCDQLDESYKNDLDKVFRHAYFIAHLTTCWDNNIMQTGSGFGRTAGQIRFFCNGYMDLVENSLDEFFEFIGECRMKGDIPLHDDYR